MAKRRPGKPKKKHEQPWLAAAKERLYAAGDARHADEMARAFFDLAAPGLEGEEEARAARFSYDRRLMVAAWAETRDDTINVQAAAVHVGRAA
jgi:hypothetical protein